MQVALVSSCTNRKKLAPSPELLARDLVESPLEELAREWKRRISSSANTVPARDLYAGRAFTEAVSAARDTHARLHIVSAGLGLIGSESRVPSYSLTVVGNDQDNVLTKSSTKAAPKDWWDALNRELGHDRPLADMVEQQQAYLFVLALPSTYIELVADDLSSLSDSGLARIRIIGLPNLGKVIPKSLSDALVPYDERLEAAESGNAGTRSDFPQRAARHFITSVLADPKVRAESSKQHAARVSEYLKPLTRPTVPMRQRYTDDMLKDVIRGMWGESEGRVTNGLRLLRRQRQIACEQSRFKRLFWEVAEEKARAQ